MKSFAKLILIASAFGWLPGNVQSQPFPTGPITVVVPLAPGDAADIAARAQADELSRLLNTPVVTVNRPGAGGAVGTSAVVQARKDGLTILFAQNSALTFRAVLEPRSVTYDALRDLVPLGSTSRTPIVLVVRSDAPYRTFAEMIEYAKKYPRQVRIGQPGSGSVGDFCVQLINGLTSAELVSVPYVGAAPAISALHGQHIEGVVLSLGSLSGHIKSNAFRALVTSSRLSEFVDVPTMRDLGYPDELFDIWFSFHAPAGIPEVARSALVGAIEQAVGAPAITTKLASLGIVQSYATPEQTAEAIRAEFRRVSEMAKKAGLVK